MARERGRLHSPCNNSIAHPILIGGAASFVLWLRFLFGPYFVWASSEVSVETAQFRLILCCSHLRLFSCVGPLSLSPHVFLYARTSRVLGNGQAARMRRRIYVFVLRLVRVCNCIVKFYAYIFFFLNDYLLV